MRAATSTLCLAALILTLTAETALAAPTSVATKMQLHGHLPDLGEAAAMWVFDTAASYDAFRVRYGVADVMPDSASLYMTFDTEFLALYTRGNDSGGRCLRVGSVSAIVGDTAVLDLAWDASSCGAPPSAHYPFVLASLSRAADDRSAWTSGRRVCAAAPGVDGSRACVPASGAAPSPSPVPSPTPTPSPRSPLPLPSATPSPTRTASSTPTSLESASPSPTATPSPPQPRSNTPKPSASAVVAGSNESGGFNPLDGAWWLVIGIVLGAFVAALVMRPRVYRV